MKFNRDWGRENPSLVKWLRLLIVFVSMASSEVAANPVEEEDLLRAAFIYNFTKFTRWPEGSWNSAANELRLCTSGNDGVVEALGGLSGRTVQGHPLEVLPLASVETPAACHVLYLAESDDDNYAELTESIRGYPVLTVTQLAEEEVPAAMIRLFYRDRRVRFSIDMSEASRSGLGFSSRLLDLAEEIR